MRKELALALSRELTLGRTLVLPVRLDRCRPPASLADKLWCDLSAQSRDWDGQLEKLIEAIGLPTRRARRRYHPKPLTATLPTILKSIGIVEIDCGAQEGLRLTDVWANGLFVAAHQRAAGRVLSAPVRTTDDQGHENLLPRNALVSADTLRHSDGPITVRSLLRCHTFSRARGQGFCSKCYGVDPSTNELIAVGSRIGRVAATTIVRALRSLKTVPQIATLLEPTPTKEASLISPDEGIVKVVRMRSTSYRLGITGEWKYSFSTALRPLVRTGDHVWAGQVLTSGTPSPNTFIDTFGQRFTESYLITELRSRIMSLGVKVLEPHIELLVALILSRVIIEDAGDDDSKWLEGRSVPDYWRVPINEERLNDGRRPLIARPVVTGLTDLVRLKAFDRKILGLT